MKLLCTLVILLGGMTACQTHTTSMLIGEWIEPIPGMANKTQGFKLDKKGKASSINMHTLKYEKWKQLKDSLILEGKSIGNGQTLSFSDTFLIKKISADSLILQKDKLILNYTNRLK